MFVGVVVVLFGAALGATGVDVETFPTPGRLFVDLLGNFLYQAFTSVGLAVCYAELRRLRDGAMPSELASVFA